MTDHSRYNRPLTEQAFRANLAAAMAKHAANRPAANSRLELVSESRARAAELNMPTYYLAADAENRFREYVEDALNIDKSLREAWARFEKLLTMFPAARPASSVRDTAETTRYFVDLDGHDEPIIWQGTGPDDPNCQPIVRKCTLDGQHPVLWPTLVKALTGQDPADSHPVPHTRRVWRDDVGLFWDEQPGDNVKLRATTHSVNPNLALPLAEATESYGLTEVQPEPVSGDAR